MSRFIQSFFRYVNEKYRYSRRGIEAEIRDKKDFRKEDYERHHERKDRRRGGNDRRSFRDVDTPKFKLPNTPSNTLWDEEDFPGHKSTSKRSSRDFETPRDDDKGSRKDEPERELTSIWRSERDRRREHDKKR
jgi:hypothetical protein